MTPSLSRRTVGVDVARLEVWLDGFAARHGAVSVVASGTGLDVTAADGATAEITLPFPWGAEPPAAQPDPADAVAAVTRAAREPRRTLVVTVRRGGYLCAVVADGRVVESKVGRRRVQGRIAAGGWSQQRYARRRGHQTDELVDAVVTWAVRLGVDAAPPDVVVPGGDRPLAARVLADPRLRALTGVPRAPHLDLPDPDRGVVDALPRLVTRVVVRLSEPVAAS